MFRGSLHCDFYHFFIETTIDGGAYAISSALGQADTGTLNGGGYSLGGGFFGGGVSNAGTRSNTYLPMLRR